MSSGEDHETHETWVFGGSRVLSGKRVHAWVPLNYDGLTEKAGKAGPELLFKATGSFVVGSEYDVRASREDDRVSKIGTPAYLGQHENAELRAGLEASHRAAETTLGRLALERNDKRRSALDEALAPVITLMKGVPYAQRDAFMVYIQRKLFNA